MVDKPFLIKYTKNPFLLNRNYTITFGFQKNLLHSLPGICGVPQWKGDTYCDDENNNAGCDWDGGDCCGANVKKTYCIECECKDPSAGGGNTDCSKYNNE